MVHLFERNLRLLLLVKNPLQPRAFHYPVCLFHQFPLENENLVPGLFFCILPLVEQYLGARLISMISFATMA